MKLKTNHGTITLPSFFPDATAGVVRGVDSTDLRNCKIEGLVVNTYHLLQKSLIKTIKDSGGIHKFMDWKGPAISDSGGFQVMSLIRDRPKSGNIGNNKITFSLEGKRTILTPEKCIEIQLRLGTDIIMCLDDCTRAEASIEEQNKSIDRTVRWAKVCKQEFERLTKNRKNKPLLFGIIQGGNHKDLRKHCAEELIKIGFDGYAFGGWPVDENGILLSDILEYTAKLMPSDRPKYAMGVGKPENIVECFKMGYLLFDCVVPTREARNKKLYFFTVEPTRENLLNGKFYDNLYLQDGEIKRAFGPISEFCDCECCKNYSQSYLHNLFKLKDALSVRFATMHNLRFYAQMMEALKE